MPIPIIIGAGSGLVAAALFASAATATALAGILFYLAPLPLCLAGLGWGSTAAILSALTGSLVVAVVLGPMTGAVFALSVGVPMALLCYLALLSRPAAALPGQASGALEWYPAGRLVGWAAVMAGVLAAALVLILGYDAETYRDSIREILEHSTLKELDPDGTLLNDDTIAGLSSVLARALPAALAVVWLSISLFNLWIAGLIVDASGRALRPWPRMDALELPNAFFLLFAGALLISFLPGLVGALATGLAGALLFAYVLQGLAVLHAWSRGFPLRRLLLAAVYLGIVLLGWVAIGVAVIGLSEPMLRLRDRAAMGSGAVLLGVADKWATWSPSRTASPAISCCRRARRSAPPRPTANASSVTGRSSRPAISNSNPTPKACRASSTAKVSSSSAKRATRASSMAPWPPAISPPP